MPSRKTKNVSLTPELDSYIAEAVASGAYQTASEVIRAGLRLLQAQDRGAGRKRPSPGRTVP